MSSPETASGARLQLVALSAAMILGMCPWFSATVAAPGMIAEWGTGPSSSAWLTIAVQIGFVVGTCISGLLLLSDRFNARRLAGSSAIVAAAATAILAVPGIGPTEAIALRGITGAALA